MDYLTFISEQLFSAAPRIEAPLDGLWRLEESRFLNHTGCDDLSYMHEPDHPESFWLDVRSRDAAFYNNCRLCSDAASRCCPTCNTRDYFPFTFDPQKGLFVNRDTYYFVSLLTFDKLRMLELGELGRGVVASCRYSRIG